MASPTLSTATYSVAHHQSPLLGLRCSKSIKLLGKPASIRCATSSHSLIDLPSLLPSSSSLATEDNPSISKQSKLCRTSDQLREFVVRMEADFELMEADFERQRADFELVKAEFEQKKPDSDSEGTRADFEKAMAEFEYIKTEFERLQASLQWIKADYERRMEVKQSSDPNDESTNLVQIVYEAEGISTSTSIIKTSGPYAESTNLIKSTAAAAAAVGEDEELEKASKFSYFATALAGGGLVSLFVFHQLYSGKSPTLLANLINFFALAAFASGLSIIIAIWAPSFSCQVPIIRGLIYVTIGFIALSLVSVSIALMKAMSVLIFVPIILVVIVACWKNRKRDGQRMRRPAV